MRPGAREKTYMSGQAHPPQGDPTVGLRVAGEDDIETAAGLFRGYLDFYGVAVEDPDRPRAFLAERIRAGESLVLLADLPGAGTVGFAQVYRTFSSLAMRPVWILYDLYVAPLRAARRRGPGAAAGGAAARRRSRGGGRAVGDGVRQRRRAGAVRVGGLRARGVPRLLPRAGLKHSRAVTASVG
ncbi:hypothetical protein GCM10020254_40080 [Streptomyces goshikiensis]